MHVKVPTADKKSNAQLLMRISPHMHEPGRPYPYDNLAVRRPRSGF